MKRLFSFLLLVLAPSCCFGQWTLQQVPTNQQLRHIYFADTSNGWVSGLDGLFHSTDGGNTWTHQSSRIGTIAGLSAVELWAAGDRDTLLHSTDGGDHFEVFTTSQYLDLDSVRFCPRIYFNDSSMGWAAVQGWKNGSPVVRLIKTTDGGNHWSMHSISSPGFNPRIPYVFIQFLDRDTGWVTADLSSVYRTFDGGDTWDSLSSIAYIVTMDMQFLNDRIGWVSTDGPALTTRLVETLDGGKTWAGNGLVFECSDNTTHFKFADTLLGWAVQTTCVNELHTEVWRTSDGGGTWKLQYNYAPSFYFRARGVFFADKDHGWIIGEQGVLLHTTNGGVTGVTPEAHLIPEGFVLDQNYPNPFNPTTVIRFGVASQGHIRIVITDILGREIRTLVDEAVSPGVREVLWDGAGDLDRFVSSGIYICRMDAEMHDGRHIFQKRKMTLIR